MRGTIAKPYITLCILCLLIIASIPALPRRAEAARAMSSADHVYVNDNDTIDTAANNAHGVRVEDGGTVTIGSGVTIITAGQQANGLLVNGQVISDDNGSSLITAGNNLSITINGSNSSGINVRDGGTVIVGDNAKISVEYPKTDSTVGTYGVAAWLGDNTTIAFGKSADISTVGNSVTAVYASGNNSGVTLGEGAVISTAGDSAFGLDSGLGAEISADNGLKVTTEGKNAIGVYTLGTTKLGDNTTISTIGQNADGLYARGGTTTIGDNLSITTEGKGAYGVEAFVGKSDIGNNAIIITSGDNASGLYATGAYGSGSTTPGVITVGENAKITTSGQSAYGVEAKYGATVTITSADIKTTGQGADGLHALGSGSEIIITGGGTITTTGNGSYGLMAYDGGKIDVYADINSTGQGAIGANADDSGKIRVSGDITVSGQAAIGASAKNGSMANILGDIIASGNNAIGASANAGDIYIAGSVDVTGENAHGVAAYSGSSVTVGGAVLVSGDVTDTTLGTTYSGVYANSSSVTVGGGVVTSGDELASVWADDGGFVDITGGIKANGDYTQGLYLRYGSSADITGDIEVVGNEGVMGISANDGSYVLMDGNITVNSGNNASGVYLADGASADIQGNLTVSGGSGIEGLRLLRGSYASLEGDISVIGTNNLAGVYVSVSSAVDPRLSSSADITGNIYVSGDSYVQGVRAMSSDVVLEGNITALAGSNVYGVVATNSRALDAGVGSSSVSVTGDILVSGVDSTGVVAVYGSSVNITGKLTVSGNDSVGASSNMAGSYVGIDGNVTVTGANSIGLYAEDDASVYMNGDRLYVSGTDSRAMRVEDGGAITLDGVTAGGAATGQTLAYTKSGGSIYANNGSDLYGDIINANNTLSSQLAVTLDNGSSLHGTVNDTGTYSQFTGTTLTLSDAASTWYVAGDSSFFELDVDGSTIDFSSSPAFTKVNLQRLNDSGSLWSTGGHFIMKANIAAQTADLLTVSEVGAAHGSHDITVLNIGSARTNGTEVVTLADTSPTSDVEFTLTHVVEQGGWQYTMQTAASSQTTSTPGGPVYGTLWQLRGNGSSNTGDAAINNFIGSYLMNYAETSTLLQRLGQLRETPYTSGVWARVHGGKFESNARSYVRDFDMDYGGIQIGYDRKYEIGWNGDFYAGVMFGYGKGDLDYSRAGSGEVETKTAGVYATFTSPGGFYVDTVLKYVWMDNDFDTIDSAGTHVSGGEISSGGIGYSVEVGQRIALSDEGKSGWYVEPQVQLSRTRYDGGYFQASNGLHIGTEPFTSVLGRLGMLVGYETEKTNLYAKVSRVREFDGELSIRANGSPITESMEGSWWVYGLGYASRLSDRNNLYLDIERTSGGSFRQPWRINAGWRMEF